VQLTVMAVAVIAAINIVALGAGVGGQLDQRAFAGSPDHPAIEYATRPTRDPVATLNRLIEAGDVELRWEARGGYLRSVLAALEVPIESQIVAFAKNSLQSARITPQNPRTLFFNDSVAVGSVQGGFIELAAVDPQQGVVFYTLQSGFLGLGTARFVREPRCLQCHESYSTLSVPGMLVKSAWPSREGVPMFQFGNYLPDHRTKLEERWGGWYVTGGDQSVRHMGNAVLVDPFEPPSPDPAATPRVQPVRLNLDPLAYLSPYSDIAALMVFDHQMHMTNLLTRVGWEFRVAASERANTNETAASLRAMTNELVDYLLFVDEAPLPSRLTGTSGFAEQFSRLGPRDGQGRSLRQLDLRTRLLRYPCSYMIYTNAFDGLPAVAKEAIYTRMWEVLSGADRSKQYSRLSLIDRRAVVEILRETKTGLPGYFQQVVQ
jgi:hypothetical protein